VDHGDPRGCTGAFQVAAGASNVVSSFGEPAMSRPNTCRFRARGVALAVALTAAAVLTFAVVQTAGALIDLAAAVHLSA
jgi:hypothetical protein